MSTSEAKRSTRIKLQEDRVHTVSRSGRSVKVADKYVPTIPKPKPRPIKPQKTVAVAKPVKAVPKKSEVPKKATKATAGKNKKPEKKTSVKKVAAPKKKKAASTKKPAAKKTAAKKSTTAKAKKKTTSKKSVVPKKKVSKTAAAGKKKAPPKKKATPKKAVTTKTKVVAAAHVKKTTGKQKAGLGGTSATPLSVSNQYLEIDAGVEAINKEIFDNGSIDADEDSHPFSAQLSHRDPSINSDKYYILQMIEHDDQRYVYRRNGRTGTKGQGQLDGPFDYETASKEFNKLFSAKTGQKWATRVAGQEPTNAKHYTYLKTNWEARAAESEKKAKWQYYLQQDPLGKPDGWYDYDENASDEVEQLYHTFVIDNNTQMAIRHVHSDSSGYTYKVDLSENHQTNTTSGKVRPIRRNTAS